MKPKEFLKQNWIYLLCGATLITNLFINLVKIDGSSMTDTYKNNQLVLVNKMDRNPQIGDVIICKVPSEKNYIKRVIATGGDVVNIDYNTGEVFVNGKKLTEDYLKDGVTKLPIPDVGEGNTLEVENNKIFINGTLRYESVEFPFTVSEDCYFVMGDNRLGSFDSREKNIGEIPQDKVIGTVIGGHKDILYN